MAPDRMIGNLFSGLSAATGIVVGVGGDGDGPGMWKILAKVIIVVMLLGWLMAGILVKYGMDSIMDSQKNLAKGQTEIMSEVKPLCSEVAAIKVRQEMVLKENEKQWDHIFRLEGNYDWANQLMKKAVNKNGGKGDVEK